MNMTVLDGAEKPDVSDEDPDRSGIIKVTLIKNTCIDTGDSVFTSLSGHRFSQSGQNLGDDVFRTKVSLKVFMLLFIKNKREDTIRNILISNL